MIDFFSGCSGLFSDIFQAACELEFFRFFAGFLVFQIFLGLFLLIYHGSRKL